MRALHEVSLLWKSWACSMQIVVKDCWTNRTAGRHKIAGSNDSNLITTAKLLWSTGKLKDHQRNMKNSEQLNEIRKDPLSSILSRMRLNYGVEYKSPIAKYRTKHNKHINWRLVTTYTVPNLRGNIWVHDRICSCRTESNEMMNIPLRIFPSTWIENHGYPQSVLMNPPEHLESSHELDPTSSLQSMVLKADVCRHDVPWKMPMRTKFHDRHCFSLIIHVNGPCFLA